MSARYFSDDYFEARGKFLQRAADTDAVIESRHNPHAIGPAGEPLYTDVAVWGDPQAGKAVVIVSGTHGNEGFCGSGCQVGFLAEGWVQRCPADTLIIMIHALNAHGFANVRRVNEDNVDLNRNFVDHDAPYQPNPGYADLHQYLVPEDWSPECLRAANKALAIYRDEKGPKSLQNAISGGQHTHPDGVFFGGVHPAWSNTTLRSIVRQHLANKTHVALLDFHTGLGPYGFGELILNGDFEHSYERAQHWYNNEVTSFQDGSSTSASLTGMMCNAFLDQMPAASLTGIAIEYGTLNSAEVLQAMRFDNWINLHEAPGSDRWNEGKQAIRDALYCDNDEWKRMVWERAEWVLKRAFRGLGSVA